MSHAHHFLSRLDRINQAQVDFALALYRDHELVRYVLAAASLPERAERVAISIDDPNAGPYLIVTRDGKFVTCLGAGMSTGDLPVLTRGKLDALMAKRDDVRRRVLAAIEVTQGAGSGQLVERLFKAGPFLCREDFVALSGLHVVLADRLGAAYFGAATKLEELRDRLIKIERPKPPLFPALREYWDTFWALGHLAILAFLDGKAMIERWSEKMEVTSPLAWGAVRQGNSLLALRGAWVAAKTGKLQLRLLKTLYEEKETPLLYLTSALSLGAIGCRHARLREEIRKVIVAPCDTSGTYVSNEVAEMARETTLRAFDEPEPLIALHRLAGATNAVRWSSTILQDGELRFSRIEDVPDDIAMPLATHNLRPYFKDGDSLSFLFICLPWLARAEPEQLFLPRKFIGRLELKWTPEQSVALMEPLRVFYRDLQRSQNAVNRGRPTRQGPCPCGSGKKYKRCCEEKDEA